MCGRGYWRIPEVVRIKFRGREQSRPFPYPEPGEGPLKSLGVFLRPVPNIGLNIAKRCTVALVADEKIRREEPPNVPQKRLTTNDNVFRRTDGRWQSAIWYFDEQGAKGLRAFCAKIGMPKS